MKKVSKKLLKLKGSWGHSGENGEGRDENEGAVLGIILSDADAGCFG